MRHIELADLRWALTRGMEDFGASRTDVIFLCVVYPLMGLLLARLASGYDMLPLIFPLASGFALVGPLAAVGLNEMSRRREMGQQAGWADAFAVFRSPAIGGIVLLGAILLTMFLFWLVLSNVVYNLTLGPQPPASLASFVRDIFLTHAGRTMAVVGVGAGLLVRGNCADNQCCIVPNAIRPRRSPRDGDTHFGQGGGAESTSDGGLGSDHRS